MAYFPTASRLGLANFTQVDVATPLYNLGTLVTGEDSSLGGGEFIYIPGVANAVVGSLVSYNPAVGTTVKARSTVDAARFSAPPFWARVHPREDRTYYEQLRVTAFDGSSHKLLQI